ncbi:MAG TPA: hypothetical protein VMM84_19370 [Pyrinomonadaceae bacterium]|nr:hypothetical protein [Pyrinomonadaceae bacterium]
MIVYLVPLTLLLILTASCAFLQPEIAEGQGGGSIIKVSPSQDLQSVIDRARPGDTIELEAGKVYKGPITLPRKDGGSYITIQSSRVGELPEGERVGPAQSVLFAKLHSATPGEPAIKTAAGSHHYRFIGLEISTATEDVKIYDLVRIGDSRQTAADVPHDFIIDRSWIHGWPTQDVQRGVSLNGAEITISNSYISEIHGRGYDTQALCGWNGPGPFRIINNYLEASGENIMFGGADPSIANLVPSNIEIRRNYLFKPLTWKVGHPTYAGIHWSVKNLLEIKMGRNIVIDGNVLENSWGDAQIGYAVLFTVRNQDGKAPWAVIENVIFTNNIVKNSEQGFQLLGKDSPNLSQRASGLQIVNNLFTGIRNRFLTMSGYHNVTLSHNTHFQNGNIISFHGESSKRFVYTDNLTNRSASGYGIFGDGVGEGKAAIARFAPDHVISNNIFIGASQGLYPPKNAFPASVSDVRFVDFQGGNFRLASQSRFKGTASDRGDPGCHFDRLPQEKTIDKHE